MATKADLDAAQAVELSAIGTLGADLTATLTALEAKIAAGSPPQDLQAEVDAAKSIAAKLGDLDTQVKAATGPAGTQTPAPATTT